jgi:hypothetical protein
MSIRKSNILTYFILPSQRNNNVIGTKKPRKKPQFDEYLLQKRCVAWFDYCYPEYRMLLFHPANGGKRPTTTKYTKGKIITYSPEAERMKQMGTRAGVSDLIFMLPVVNPTLTGKYNCLCLELKAGRGKQEPEQIEFEQKIASVGHKYVIIRNFDEFREAIWDHLGQNIGQLFFDKNPERSLITGKLIK